MNQFYQKYYLNNDELFGEGSFGQMHSCRMIGDVDCKIACCVKIIPIKFTQKNQEVNEIIKRLQSQQNSSINLVKIFDIFFDDQNLLIVMEKYDMDLSIEFDQLNEENCWYSEEEQLQILQQIIAGFQQLEQIKIKHLNIKPENILIQFVNKGLIDEKKIYKISDFGIRSLVEKFSNKSDFIWTGAPNYSAPQVLENGKYSSNSDIFSLGILFYQIIYNSTLPYDCGSLKKRYQSLQKLKINLFQAPSFHNLKKGDIFKNLLERMIVYDENKRMSFVDLFNDSLMKTKCLEPTQIFEESSSFFKSTRIFDKSINFEKKKKNLILNLQEQIERLLELFQDRYNICIQFINQIKNHDNLIFLQLNIYLIAQYQLLYALALIYVRPQEIHPLILEGNYQLIDKLQKVQKGIKTYQEEQLNFKLLQDQLQQEYHYFSKSYLNFQIEILRKNNLFDDQKQFFQLSRFTRIKQPIILQQIKHFQKTQSVSLSYELQNQLDQIIQLETLFPVSLFKSNQDLVSLLPNQIKEKEIHL